MDLGDRKWGTGGRLRGKGCDNGVKVEWMKEGKRDFLARRAGVLKAALEVGAGALLHGLRVRSLLDNLLSFSFLWTRRFL